MSSLIRASFVALLGSCLLADPAAAFQKTRVGVRYSTAADQVKAVYTDAELGQFSAAVLDSAISALNQKLPFVTFEPEFGGRYLAVIKLAFQDTLAVNPSTKELGMHLLLYDGSRLAGTAFQTVRDKSRSADRLPSRWDEFVVEVAAAIRSWSSEALTEQALTHVPVADSALCWSSPPGFVLPFTRDELCMGFGTMLRVVAMLDEGAGEQPLRLDAESGEPFTPSTTIADTRYLGRIFTTVRDSDRTLDLVRSNPGKLNVRFIAVRKFLPYDYCGLLPPDEVLP